MVVLVEVVRKAYLASIVPVIVNAILDHHQVIVDIVAFISKGDFPRSRLGEKQRGKILAGWVTRKLRTVAQFSIRESDRADSQITEVAEPRSAVGSVVGAGSSLRNVESASTPPAEGARFPSGDYTSLPTGISEMSANYESSIVESPRLPTEEDREDTPTEAHPRMDNHFSVSSHSHHDVADEYEDFDPSQPSPPVEEPSHTAGHPNSALSYSEYDDYTSNSHSRGQKILSVQNPSQFDFNPDAPPPTARYDSKPTLSSSTSNNHLSEPSRPGGLSSLPSQQRYSAHFGPPQQSSSNTNNDRDESPDPPHVFNGGLKVPHLADDIDEDGTSSDTWRQDALMQLNLARGSSSHSASSHEGHPGDRSGGVFRSDYEGSGYGFGHAL